MKNIMAAYDEVCRNTKNKTKVNNYKQYKCIYSSRIHEILVNKKYKPGPFRRFKIYEPKERVICCQTMLDKVVNHLVSRYILYPAIMPCLLDINVASRPKLGTSKGLELEKKYSRICKQKYGNYYILKFDIEKFFASINKEILKEKLKKRIKDKDAIKIVFDIIDNEIEGLGIGSMTSQTLAIFYLNDLDHFVKERLKIKYYIRYQDDGLLFHQSKEYLKECLEEMKKFLKKEALVLNKKTRIYSVKDNFIFLGKNGRQKYARYRTVKRKINKRNYLYKSNQIELNSLVSTLINYEQLTK